MRRRGEVWGQRKRHGMQWRGRSEGTSFCPPGEQLHIGIALDQHEAAPVPEQRGQRGVRDPALHGAVAPIAAGSVQVLGNWSGRQVHRGHISQPQAWGQKTDKLLLLSSGCYLRMWGWTSRKTRKGKGHRFSLAKVGEGSSAVPLSHHPLSPQPVEGTHVSCSRISTRRCMCSHRCHELASMDSTGFQ